MPKAPKPYIKSGWYCTSIGGVQHQKLCRIEEGEKQANLALARLLVKREDLKIQGVTAPASGPGIRSVVIQPEALAGPPALLLGQVHDDFLDFKAAEYGEDSQTYQDYVIRLKPLHDQFGSRPFASITDIDGMNYRRYLSREKPWKKGKKKVKGLKPSAVNSRLRAAKTFFNWACHPKRRQKYGVPVSPWEELELFPERSRERVITEDEFKHLLGQCTDGNVSGGARDFREALTVMRHTTMRPGELRLLRWDYIQWENHRMVYPLTVIKNRRRRSITMLPQVESVLLERKTRLEQRGVKAEGFVFPNVGKDERGKRAAVARDRHMMSTCFSQRFRRLVNRCVGLGLIEKEKAGERIVLYSHRHTRITELYVEGHDTGVVMQEAGHAVPSTTERYKHLAPGFITAVVRQRAGQRLAENRDGD